MITTIFNNQTITRNNYNKNKEKENSFIWHMNSCNSSLYYTPMNPHSSWCWSYCRIISNSSSIITPSSSYSKLTNKLRPKINNFSGPNIKFNILTLSNKLIITISKRVWSLNQSNSLLQCIMTTIIVLVLDHLLVTMTVVIILLHIVKYLL